MKPVLGAVVLSFFSFCAVCAQAPAQAQKPFSRIELLARVMADPRKEPLERAVAMRGVDFQPNEDYVDGLKAAGARDTLVDAVRKAPAPAVSVPEGTPSAGSSAAPTSANPEAVANESQVLQHLLKAAKLRHDRVWQDAENQVRAVVAVEPHDPLVHLDLAVILRFSQGEAGWHAAIAESREAIRLDPHLGLAHLQLAIGLAHKRDTAGAIAEYQEVAHLDSDDAFACGQLGTMMDGAGDLEGAITAFNEAVRRDPNASLFHHELADLLEEKGDHDAAMAQAREAIRIDPDKPAWHRDLAAMLKMRGDTEEAAKQTQIAQTLEALNPPKRIRVGGMVMRAKLVYQQRPTYPVDASMAGIEGVVRLEAIIGEDGRVLDLKLMSGDPLLAKAAMEAVSKWRYQPTLLSGEPVEVHTEIDVNFVLHRK